MVRRQIVGRAREGTTYARPCGSPIEVFVRLAAGFVVVAAVLGARPMTGVAAGRVSVCTTGCDYDKIQDAIDAVAAGTTIDLLDDEYTESGILIHKDIVIVGANAAGTVVQAAEDEYGGTDRVFEVAASATATIRDMTLRHGRVTGNPARGGGLMNHGTLTMERADVVTNQVIGAEGDPGAIAQGGGIYTTGSLVFKDGTISDNLAQGGAGASGSDDGGDGEGGGLFTGGGSARFVNATVSGNRARKGSGCGG